MAELTETWRAILNAIRRGTRAWRTPNEVADDLGSDLDQVCDDMASMDVDGWLEIWEREDGPVVTLSSLAAEALGVHLAEFGRVGTMRWIGNGDPEPPQPKARNVCQSERGAELEFLLDPHPGPDRSCELAELAAAELEQHGGVRPTLLIGVGLTPWPGPAADAPCPACGSVPMKPNSYCIRCDAWGRDANPKRGSRHVQPVPTPPTHSRPVREVEAERQQLRARRKHRRRTRLAERAVV